MLELFPSNYVWNLSTNIALAMGGNIGEIDAICRPLREASLRGDDDGTEAFFRAWTGLADRLVGQADADLARGNRLSAGARYGRAATYYITAERMQHRAFEPRKAAFQAMLDCFAKAVALRGENCRRVEIPYRGKSLAGLFVRAERADAGPAPCIALFNGLDSTKEMLYGSGLQQELARRGIGSVAVDQPGVGEALRLQGLHAIVEAEDWAGAVVDHLQTLPEVDADNIGICAWSLGGYYAPRAAAMDRRFRLCVAWGANYNWGELQKRRLQREGDRPVPHYWEHVQWVWGQPSLDEFMAFVPRVTLAPVIDRITVPFLIVHGANDRQIPQEYAEQQYAGAVNSPKRELKYFTEAEGGVEHCSADNMAVVRDYIADWIAHAFAERGAAGVRT